METKVYNFKYTAKAPKEELDMKKFMWQLRCGLMNQVWGVLIKEGDIKLNWTEKDCTVTLDFNVERESGI